jgi:hypothetical protein
MDGPLLADISGTNTPRRSALHEIGPALSEPTTPISARRRLDRGHNQRGRTPQGDVHTTITSRSLTSERSPAGPESTTEKQP